MVKEKKPEKVKPTNQRSSFLRHLGFSIMFIVILDFLSGYIIISDNYTSFRTPHYYYHHGLQPDQDTWAVWGSSLYPIK
jgi:hypothetical protein